MTQGELSQAPEPALSLLVPREEHPNTPARGCCSSPGSPGGKDGRKRWENGLKVGLRDRRRRVTRAGGEHTPAPNTLCSTEANYPNLQLEASGKRLSLKDN